MDDSHKLPKVSNLDCTKISKNETSTFPNEELDNFESVKAKFHGKNSESDQQSTMGSLCTTTDKHTSPESPIQFQDSRNTQKEGMNNQLSDDTTDGIDVGEEALEPEFTQLQNSETVMKIDSEDALMDQVKQKWEEFERQRKYFMGEFLNTAIDRRWNIMASHIENWINRHLIWDNYHTAIYELNRNITWDEGDMQKQLPLELLREFLSELQNRSETKYRNYVTEIVNTISKLESQIAKHFSGDGYLEETFLEEIFSQVYEQITNAVEDTSIRTIFQNVRERFFVIFKDYTETFSVNEANLQEEVIRCIIKRYNEKMNEFIEVGPHRMDDLAFMHAKLVTTLTEIFVNVLAISLENPSNIVIKKCDDLKKFLENGFSVHQATNLLRINQLHLKSKEVISSCQQMYTKRINEIASQGQNGVDKTVLERQHIRIKREVQDVLESEIRLKIGRDEPVHGYKVELEYLMNTYFEKVLEANNKNLARIPAMFSDEPCSSKMVSDSNCVPSAAKEDKPQNMTQHATLVIDFKNCTQLSVAVKHNDKKTVLHNEFNESETPAILGYSYVDYKFWYGNQVTWLMTRWYLSNLLDTNYNNSTGIIVDGVYRKITFEFVLAFILRKLKFAAEQQVGKVFSSALIVIPFWFSGNHRAKMQNGAKLAGFSEVNLVNESSCAAFACIPTTTNGRLLIITGNRNGVRAYQYNCNKTEMKVQMTGYWKIYDILHKYGVLDITGGKDKVTKLVSKEYHKVKKAIKKGIEEILVEMEVGNHPIPVFIAETEEWQKMINGIVRKFSHLIIVDFSDAVFCGALDLSQKEISKFVIDFLSYDIFVRDLCTRKKACEQFACLKTPLSSEKAYVTTKGSIEFLEKHELDEEMRRIELLQVQPAWSNQMVKITMGINNQGIFESKRCDPFDCGDVGEMRKTNKYPEVSRSYPNLSPKIFPEFATWLEKLLPAVSQEKLEIIKAKEILLQLCVDMTEKIESKVLLIESELCKVEVIDQISEAKEFAEHPHASMDDLKGQIEILENLYRYYSEKQK